MRRPYIVGNWKMNGDRAALGEAAAISAAAADAAEVDVALCPPATLIAPMVDAVGAMPVGGQDCHSATSGAFTGSVSAAMLVEAGARLVIVGHSERREAWGETDAMVHDKAAAALAAGLDVIICVGEDLATREAGGAIDHVLGQIGGSLPVASDGGTDWSRVAVAYEPIWAIGTGRTATPGDVGTMHAAIRARLCDLVPAGGQVIRILYGGSVTGDNARDLFAVADVDGALVGGASLTAAKFVPIIMAATAR